MKECYLVKPYSRLEITIERFIVCFWDRLNPNHLLATSNSMMFSLFNVNFWAFSSRSGMDNLEIHSEAVWLCHWWWGMALNCQHCLYYFIQGQTSLFSISTEEIDGSYFEVFSPTLFNFAWMHWLDLIVPLSSGMWKWEETEQGINSSSPWYL